VKRLCGQACSIAHAIPPSSGHGTLEAMIVHDDRLAAFIEGMDATGFSRCPEVRVLACRYSTFAYRDELFVLMGVPFPDSLAQAVSRRKAEYLAGRYLCRKLMLNQGLVAVDVPSGRHRQPLWPTGWLGSISHTNHLAVCCLVRRSRIGLLGIDVESWLSPELAKEIAPSILNEDETQCLIALGSIARRVTLAFSAKESLFKALYPRVGRYFEFTDVCVRALCEEEGRLILQIANDLSADIRSGAEFHCHFRLCSEHVLTLAAAT
jgi:enterobactin synthetase component D